MPAAKQAPTLAAISALARVSKSTVSRALSGDPRISSKTRKEIVAIAEKLGFRPNALARSLTTQRSGVVAFVISEMEHTVYQGHLENIARLVAQRGFQLMLFQVPIASELLEVVPTMAQYRPEGCIVIPAVAVSEDAIEACARYRIPLVLLNRTSPQTLTSTVQLNNWEGGHEIAEFLITGEHERFAFISGTPDHPAAQDREAGFLAGLAAGGRELHARRSGNFTHPGGYAAARELINSPVRPDAIFAAGDMMAMGAIDAIRDAGLRVGQDISVVGFDGIRAGALPAYAVTTFLHPVAAIFDRALELIVAHGAVESRPPETVYMKGKLVIRKSARLPSRANRELAVRRGWLAKAEQA